MASLKEKYIASMVLSGVGDAMGFKQGDWEFCHSGITIHEEAEKLGGIEKLKIKLPDWPVSDDTVLHLATAESYMVCNILQLVNNIYKIINPPITPSHIHSNRKTTLFNSAICRR